MHKQMEIHWIRKIKNFKMRQAKITEIVKGTSIFGNYRE